MTDQLAADRPPLCCRTLFSRCHALRNSDWDFHWWPTVWLFCTVCIACTHTLMPLICRCICAGWNFAPSGNGFSEKTPCPWVGMRLDNLEVISRICVAFVALLFLNCLPDFFQWIKMYKLHWKAEVIFDCFYEELAIIKALERASTTRVWRHFSLLLYHLFRLYLHKS